MPLIICTGNKPVQHSKETMEAITDAALADPRTKQLMATHKIAIEFGHRGDWFWLGTDQPIDSVALLFSKDEVIADLMRTALLKTKLFEKVVTMGVNDVPEGSSEGPKSGC